MKKRTKLLTLAGGLLLAAVFSLTSCTTEKYYNEYYEGPVMTTRNITVNQGRFEWNEIYRRYEFWADMREITNDIYQNGVVTVSLYIKENGYDNGQPVEYDVLKPLPFLQSYAIGGNINDTFTENISFDISPGLVGFSIQASDLSDAAPFLGSYVFKVTVFQKVY